MDARSQFLTVAHLWAAWCIRDRRFHQAPEGNYTSADDFLSFLAEAEMLREWGQSWVQGRDKAMPPLPADVWRMPEDWHPPSRQKGWPQTGGLPDIGALKRDLANLRAAGRPRKP